MINKACYYLQESDLLFLTLIIELIFHSVSFDIKNVNVNVY